MKPGYFEEGIASSAADAAQGRDEQPQCELGTFDFTLAEHGWLARRIAREWGLHRETVGRYLRLAESKPAISLAGSGDEPVSKPAILHAGSMGRQGLCVPLQEIIEAAIQAGLSAQRNYQDLASGHGFVGSYHLGVNPNTPTPYAFTRQLLRHLNGGKRNFLVDLHEGFLYTS